MPKISVAIITYNEERNIGRCLNSIAGVADEVVVVDSWSTDNTVAIANAARARVLQRAFDGYGQQKNYAANQCTHHWVLSLDADEELTAALKKTLLAFKDSQPTHSVYRIPRITNYCGQWIRHCGWYPDYQTRLFDRTKGQWQEKKVHEYWKPHDDSTPHGLLKGDLLHYSFSSISEHLKKIEKYSELAARAAVETGKTVSLVKLILAPGWSFFTSYFIRLGFLDGYYGYVICKLAAFSAFIKYSKIRAYTEKTKPD